MFLRVWQAFSGSIPHNMHRSTELVFFREAEIPNLWLVDAVAENKSLIA